MGEGHVCCNESLKAGPMESKSAISSLFPPVFRPYVSFAFCGLPGHFPGRPLFDSLCLTAPVRAVRHFFEKWQECGQIAGRQSGIGVRGIKGLLGRHPCTLTNRPHGLIEPTGTLSIWPSRIGQTRAMIPTSGRRNRESRMPHTSKLWQLEAMTHIPNHDTPPWLWSER